jgi:hypothetical protein
MLIGFTHKTSKMLPRLFCRRFRHCAVLVPLDTNPPKSTISAGTGAGGKSLNRPTGIIGEFSDLGGLTFNSRKPGNSMESKNNPSKLPNSFLQQSKLEPPSQAASLPRKTKYIMLQVSFERVNFIPLSARDLKILEQHGWVFVKLTANSEERKAIHYWLPATRSLTCVGFAKRALRIRAPLILTPDQLYKVLSI